MTVSAWASGFVVAAAMLTADAADAQVQPPAPPAMPAANPAPVGTPAPGQAPPATRAALTAPAPRPLLQVIPYLGIQAFVGDSGKGFDTGFGTGSLVGARVSPVVSLNLNLSLDFLNPVSNLPTGGDIGEVMFSAAVAPLLHLIAGEEEFVIGPSVGVYAVESTITIHDNAIGIPMGDYAASRHGWSVGGNVGLFFPVTNLVTYHLRMGMLFSLAVQRSTEECGTAPGGAETCTDKDLGALLKKATATFAMLF